MKTCKDCVHYDVCQYHIDEEIKMTVNECPHGFKDKLQYIYPPCKIGDILYITPYVRLSRPLRLKHITAIEVKEIIIRKNGAFIRWTFHPKSISEVYEVKFEEFGKTVFPSKEDAENCAIGRYTAFVARL